MKKILCLMTICLLAAGTVSAQQYYYGPRRHVRRVVERRPVDDFYKIKLGAVVGLNLANTVDAYNSDYSTGTIAGLNAGLSLELPVIYPFSIEPELLYSGKGFSADDPDGHFTSRSNFIDVPILAKFKISPNFNFLIGPQISFLTSTTNTFDDGFSLVSQDHYNYNGNTTFLDGVIGVSFDLNRNVELRARYTIDFNETDPYGYTTVPNYRNQVFQLGLGFKFQ